jgi:hypothetical protein
MLSAARNTHIMEKSKEDTSIFLGKEGLRSENVKREGKAGAAYEHYEHRQQRCRPQALGIGSTQF